MYGDDETPVIVQLPMEVNNFAEILGGLLTAKLTEALKAAFELEAKIWRTDLQRTLNEYRITSECEQTNRVESIENHAMFKKCLVRSTPPEPSVVGASLQSRFISEEPIGPSKTNASSNSSVASRVLAVSRRRNRMPSVDLEKRLAKKVIAAKLWHAPDSETLSAPRDRRAGLQFDRLVPHEPKSSENLHFAMPNQNGTDGTSSLNRIPDNSFGRTRTIAPLESHLSPDSSSSSERPLFMSGEDEAPSCTTPLSQASGGMTAHVFRRQGSLETTPTPKRWLKEARNFFDGEINAIGEPWGRARRIVFMVPRLLGLVPWDMEFVWLSRIYQFALSLVLTLSTVSVTARLSWHHAVKMDSLQIVDQVDNILAIGSLFGFLACLVKNKDFVDSHFLIESYLSKVGFLEELNNKSCAEVAAIGAVWLLCLGSRFYLRAFYFDLHDFGYAFNVPMLLGVCAYLLRLCRGLNYIVDSFCEYITDEAFDFDDAMQEWFLFHCVVRTACSTLQLCFVVLQLTAMGMFLFSATSFYLGHRAIGDFMLMVPGALCIIVSLWLSMRAALVSDLCGRVPMLVNSSNAKFDPKRMYLVDYIVHCEAGFYIFEVRLTSAMLVKTFYVACVATLGLVTQVWSQNK